MSKIFKIIGCILIMVFSADLVCAYQNNVYIWQRNWDEYLEAAISEIQNTTCYFTVLCGDLKFDKEEPVITSVNIKWNYLTQTETSAILAFRINTQASKFFAANDIYPLVDSISNAIYETVNSAPEDEVVGIQFDYDCPTARLKDYVRFLKIMQKKLLPLKQRFSEFNISITALPTWLQSGDFKDLAKVTDYYVLQLHSFELPKNAKQANKIFPYDKAISYIEKASMFQRPYYVSLPTYGYEIVFSKEGKFLGLRAESKPTFWGKDVSYKTEIADPNEVFAFLQYLKDAKPKHFLGIHWFRLPLKSDEFNWNIKTLIALIEGRQPSVNVETELIISKDGLYEIYIINSGEQNIVSPVRFELKWNEEIMFIYDVLGQYLGNRTEKGLEITGPAPSLGNKVLVGWLKSPSNIKNNIHLEMSDVEICKDN